MITLTTFQKYIIKFYILPLYLASFRFSVFLTYNITKFFTNGITTTQRRQTTQIKRKNVNINGKYFKNWTILEEIEKNEILDKYDIKTLETLDNFKVIRKNGTEQITLNDDNLNEYYNFLIFLKTLFLNFKFGLILMFGLPLIPLFIFYKKYYLENLKHLEKFINLPFFLSSLNSSYNEEKTKKIIDRFLKYDKDNNCYLYKTNSISQKLIYEKNLTEIENYLKLQNLNIIQNDLIITIEERKIKKIVNFDKNDYLEDMLYLGETEKEKKIFLKLSELQHTIIVGQSGSGKSVFLQNILLNIFRNLKTYEKIYLVDFKLVEMTRYRNKHKKIEVIDEILDFFEMIKNMNNLMKERLRETTLKNQGSEYVGKSIMIIIDEFRSIKMGLDKKQQSELDLYLKNLIQKRRRRKIFLIFRGQKRDTTNIDSNLLRNIMNKIILKTTSNHNITSVRGNREELESCGISLNEIKNFGRGRLFYKDELNGGKFLIQSPFFNVRDETHREFMFSFLENEEEETEKTENILNDTTLNEYKPRLNEEKKEIKENIQEKQKTSNNPIKINLNTISHFDLLNLCKKQYSKIWESLDKNDKTDETKTKKRKLMNIKRVLNLLEKSENMDVLKDITKQLKEI